MGTTFRSLTLFLLITTLMIAGSAHADSPPYTGISQGRHHSFTRSDDGLWYSGHSSTLRVPPPEGVGGPSLQSATITINYVTGVYGPFDEYCLSWPAEAQAAFNYAVSIWESQITSSVPIEIDACWGEIYPTGVLGYSGPYNYMVNFDGAPRANTYYPVALANALSGTDLDTTHADMYIAYNSLWADTGDWYFGTDGNPSADQIDFASVVLHEITHGLGFIGSMRVYNGVGSWGSASADSYTDIFDTFGENGSGQRLVDTTIFANPSAELANQLISNNLFFDGLNANSANNGSPATLYAPTDWSGGSSFYHLGDNYNDTENALMTWSIDSGSSIHSPGPIVLGILKDIGWSLASVAPDPDTPPSLSVNPTSGPQETSFVYSGSNFVPGETVNIWLIDPLGTRYDASPKVADDQGDVTGSWIVESSDPTGTYTISAVGAQGQQTVSVSFTVTESTPAPSSPALTVDPSSAPVGTRFTYEGTGFTPNETVATMLVDEQGTSYTGPTLTADTNGTFSSWWLVEAGDPIGVYTIYATGAQSQQPAEVSFTVTAASNDPSGPSLITEPVWGPPDTQIVYTGSGFAADERVTAWVIDPSGVSADLPTMTADAQGEVSSSIVPAGGSGTYTLYVQSEQDAQSASTSFTVTAPPDPADRVPFTGTFMNTTVGTGGEVTLNIALGTDRVTGFMNFTNAAGASPMCGAGELVGTRQGNELVWEFSSNDAESGCGFDRGYHFTIESTISADLNTIAGDYTVTYGGQSQQGTFQINRTSGDTTPTEVVSVQTSDDGSATATLRAGTVPGTATVVGVIDNVLSSVNVEFTSQQQDNTVFLPLIVRGSSTATVQSRVDAATLNQQTGSTPYPSLAALVQEKYDGYDGKIAPATVGSDSQPARIVLVSAESEIPADGDSTTTISIRVEDANGNALPDQVVVLGTTLGTLSTVFVPSPDEITPEQVTITGPTTGDVDTYYAFNATVSPSGVENLSYYWSPEPAVGQGSNAAVYAWDSDGVKNIIVQATNSAGSATGTFSITMGTDTTLVPPSAVSIDGPTTGVTSQTYTFTAQVSPSDATTPMSFSWDTGTGTVVHTDMLLEDSISVTWDTVGTKTVTVVAENEAGSISASYTVEIGAPGDKPPASVTIDGPVQGDVGTDYTFVATVSPSDVTVPLTFTWQTPSDMQVHTTTQPTDSVSVGWNFPGTKTIQVTVENSTGVVTGTHTIEIMGTVDMPVVYNSGFENGRDGNWLEASLNNLILIQNASTLPVVPYAGDWAAWLGGQDNEENYISQLFTLPSGSSIFVHFYYFVGTQEPACNNDGTGDIFAVFVNNTEIGWMELCPDEAGGWYETSVDVSSYAGQSVYITFDVVNDDMYNSNIFLDDISFQSSAASLQGGGAGILHPPR